MGPDGAACVDVGLEVLNPGAMRAECKAPARFIAQTG
jgi:hypothetical protein